jgi:O-acetyl-ADP-ribose deacetylase (regulator of RNase III)
MSYDSMDPFSEMFGPLVPKFDKKGTVLTSEERAETAKRKGLCAFCGVKTHKIKYKGLVRIRLTNDDVHEGLCIRCEADKVTNSIVNAWECNNSIKYITMNPQNPSNHTSKTHSESDSSNLSSMVEPKPAYAKAQRRAAEAASLADDYTDGVDFGGSDKSTKRFLIPLATYRLPAAPTHRLSLILAQGSILDFDNRMSPAAIVNDANVGCRGGGGVDRAISNAGGPNLDRDRARLPVVTVTDAGDPVRCPVGQAVVTGPGKYGSLQVPYVIHAVGPKYYDYDDDDDDLTPVHNLLKSAYKSALDCAAENKIQSMAFSLLSAGFYRGSQPLEAVLAHGITAIQDWSASYAKQTGGNGDTLLSKIVICAYTENECESLQAACDSIMSSTLPALLYPLVTYKYLLPAAPTQRLFLILAQGSVLDFDNRIAPAAIVNAANVGCLGGGGVDGAISSAGGPNLGRDRAKLPVVAVTDAGDPVRCPVGQAVVTGPNEYGSLQVPYVIHAVGPNYCDYDDDADLTPVHNLLKSAYKSALDCAVENKIQSVAFSLLSAGFYRGSQPLEAVLAHGVTAIQEWSASYAKQTGGKGDARLSQIVLCAYTENECESLQLI